MDLSQHSARSASSRNSAHDETDEKSSTSLPSHTLHDEKVKSILQACKEKNIEALIRLATSTHGLVKDEVRRVAWPILLGCGDTVPQEKPSWSSLPVHKDEEQVRLDVDRSFVYYPSNESHKQIDLRKRELSNVITEVLRRHPNLNYFQGYHDIVQVALLVLGPDAAASAVARISILRIRDFMLPSMSAAISHLRLLPPILYAADRELFEHIQGAQPFFALAATLTLYAHDIQEYGDIARLFDFLLAWEAAISVYLYAAIILARKTELLDIPRDEPEMQHFVLSKLPQPLDLESLISSTTRLFTSFPPETLPFRAWSKVSPYSVLKTTQNPAVVHKQTFDYGQDRFHRQAVQIRRTEAVQKALRAIQRTVWVYRRPAGAVALAIAVGALALWLGRSGNGASMQRSLLGVFEEWAHRALGHR